MKTLEWLKFFADQKQQHGKILFSVTELANVAQTSLHSINTELHRLVARGVVVRHAQGRYASTTEMMPEDLVPSLDAGAYITGFYALFRHNLVTQVPVRVTCFTDRRHNRNAENDRRPRALDFVCVPREIYRPPTNGIITSPEQALCDFVWLNARDGIDARHLVTFRNLERLNLKKVRKRAAHYPERAQTLVTSLVDARSPNSYTISSVNQP